MWKKSYALNMLIIHLSHSKSHQPLGATWGPRIPCRSNFSPPPIFFSGGVTFHSRPRPFWIRLWYEVSCANCEGSRETHNTQFMSNVIRLHCTSALPPRFLGVWGWFLSNMSQPMWACNNTWKIEKNFWHMENRKELLTPGKSKRTSIQTSLKNQFTNTVLSQPFKKSTVIKRLY